MPPAADLRAAASAPGGLDAWIDRAPGAMLAILLVFASAARLVSYQQIKDGPLLHLHVWTETDMNFYDRWAQEVASGNLLTNTRMRPDHSGHAAVARQAHELAGSSEPFDVSAGERRWDEWLGEKTFYQDPLYPYLVAGVYALFGRRMGAVALLQAVLGLGTVAMIFWLTRSMFGGVASALAGLVAALYGPLIYYETLLLKPVLITFTGFAGLCLVVRALDAPASIGRHLAAGLACGAAFLAQSAAVLFLAPALAVVALRPGRMQVPLWRNAGMLVIGFVLTLAPVAARNLVVGAPPFVFNATGGWTFMNHNAEDYEPAVGDTVTRHAGAIMERTRGSLLPAVVETFRTQPSLTHWLMQLGGKLAWFWHWYEIPNNANFEYYRLQAPVSRLFFAYPAVAPLAALGLTLGLWRSAVSALAAIHVGSGLAMLLIFYQISRLRLPTSVAMIPFAAFGAVCLVRLARQRRYRGVAAGLAATVTLTLLILRPLPPGRSVFRLADYGVANEIAAHLARQRFAAGDAEGAARVLERQLAIEPANLREPGSTRLTWLEAEASGSFAKLHAVAADLYQRMGRPDRAREHGWRARVLAVIANGHAQTKKGLEGTR